jgi:hypothetical protein
MVSPVGDISLVAAAMYRHIAANVRVVSTAVSHHYIIHYDYGDLLTACCASAFTPLQVQAPPFLPYFPLANPPLVTLSVNLFLTTLNNVRNEYDASWARVRSGHRRSTIFGSHHIFHASHSHHILSRIR